MKETVRKRKEKKNGTEFDGTVKIGEISPSTISKKTKPKTMCERESRFQASNTNRFSLSLCLSPCLSPSLCECAKAPGKSDGASTSLKFLYAELW
jgi:hypothetical protein